MATLPEDLRARLFVENPIFSSVSRNSETSNEARRFAREQFFDTLEPRWRTIQPDVLLYQFVNLADLAAVRAWMDHSWYAIDVDGKPELDKDGKPAEFFFDDHDSEHETTETPIGQSVVEQDDGMMARFLLQRNFYLISAIDYAAMIGDDTFRAMIEPHPSTGNLQYDFSVVQALMVRQRLDLIQLYYTRMHLTFSAGEFLLNDGRSGAMLFLVQYDITCGWNVTKANFELLLADASSESKQDALLKLIVLWKSGYRYLVFRTRFGLAPAQRVRFPVRKEVYASTKSSLFWRWAAIYAPELRFVLTPSD